MILIILGVIAIFSLLVIAHEWGHFTAARRAGVKVEEFGVGFPPRVWSIRRGGTLYSINLLPVGGFVRLKGEDGRTKGKDSFATQTFWRKTKILMAGVFMNLLIAYLIFTALLIFGMPPLLETLPSFGPIKPSPVSEPKLTIMDITKDSAAAKAGLQTSDIIMRVNGKTLETNEQLKEFTASHAGQEVTLLYRHENSEIEKTIQLGTNAETGYLGVVSTPIVAMRYPIWAAPIAAVVLMGQLIWATLGAFGGLIVSLFTKAKVSDQVAGPIGVVSIFSQIVRFGAGFIAIFVASISLSLAVINALPLPALDGGREFVLILQKLGLKITPERENIIHLIGFAALIGLMIVISISDIARLRQ